MKYLNYITYSAYILVILGAILYLPMREVAPYVFVVGCALMMGVHLAERYNGHNLRQKRNNRTRHLDGILYAVAGYLMFQPGMYWLLVLSCAVVLDLYTMWVMGKE